MVLNTSPVRLSKWGGLLPWVLVSSHQLLVKPGKIFVFLPTSGKEVSMLALVAYIFLSTPRSPNVWGRATPSPVSPVTCTWSAWSWRRLYLMSSTSEGGSSTPPRTPRDALEYWQPSPYLRWTFHSGLLCWTVFVFCFFFFSLKGKVTLKVTVFCYLRMVTVWQLEVSLLFPW